MVCVNTNAEEQLNGRLQSGKYFVKLFRSAVEIDMKTSNRQLGNVGKVGLKASEVGVEKNLGRNLGEGV